MTRMRRCGLETLEVLTRKAALGAVVSARWRGTWFFLSFWAFTIFIRTDKVDANNVQLAIATERSIFMDYDGGHRTRLRNTWV